MIEDGFYALQEDITCDGRLIKKGELIFFKNNKAHYMEDINMKENEGYNTIQNFEYIIDQISQLNSSEFDNSIMYDLVSALKIVESLYISCLKK